MLVLNCALSVNKGSERGFLKGLSQYFFFWGGGVGVKSCR